MTDKVVLDNVRKEIKGSVVLGGINVSFQSGNIYGIRGQNGSGKTMLLRAISGLIKLSSGRITIDGKVLHEDIDYPQSIGVMIENPQFWKHYTGYQVLKTLAAIKKIISEQEIKMAIERVGLDPEDKRHINKYSLGMKQRIGIAQAIMEKPEIILLDEPTNALDQSGIQLIRNVIREEKERGALVIIATHEPNEIAMCDRIVTMMQGRISDIADAT